MVSLRQPPESNTGGPFRAPFRDALREPPRSSHARGVRSFPAFARPSTSAGVLAASGFTRRKASTTRSTEWFWTACSMSARHSGQTGDRRRHVTRQLVQKLWPQGT